MYSAFFGEIFVSLFFNQILTSCALLDYSSSSQFVSDQDVNSLSNTLVDESHISSPVQVCASSGSVEEVCCEVPTRLFPPVHNTIQHDVLMTDCKQEMTDVPSFEYELVDSNQGITSGFTDCIENESNENNSRMSVSMENSSLNDNVVDSKVW